MAQHNEIGKIGEDIATKWLITKGHDIIDRNFHQKWGEIDVISKKSGKIHFVEVKSVSYETRQGMDYAVSHETWRPEDRVHVEKLKRLSRTIQTWIHQYKQQEPFQIDVLVVRIVPREKIAKVKIIENIIIE